MPVAPVVNVGFGVPAIPPGGYTTSSGGGWDSTENIGALHGGRYELIEPFDFSDTELFLSFRIFTKTYAPVTRLESHENGGVVVVFQDRSGEWIGWSIQGNDVRDYIASSASADGLWSTYSAYEWLIDVNSVPDFSSSGVIDLSDITHMEYHLNPLVAQRFSFYPQYMGLVSRAECVGDFKLTDIIEKYTNNSDIEFRPLSIYARSTPARRSSSEDNYFFRLPISIGDGITQTTFQEKNFNLFLENLWQDEPDFQSVGRSAVIDSVRSIDVNQSGLDVVQIENMTIASSSLIGWRVFGSASGICELNNCRIIRTEVTQLGHGSYTDTQFIECKAPVEVTAQTSLNGCSFRDGDYGIKLLAGPGDYSALEMRFGGIAVHDIQIGSGGAGTYDLSGVTVRAGDTLKIHNDSANDISVILPPGTTYTTTTDGGAIAVISPPTTYTLQMPNIQQHSRVQIYNATSGAELLNDVVGAGGVNHTMISGVDYTAGDTGRVRVAYQSGAVAFDPIELEFTFSESTTVNALPLVQSAAASHNDFGLDGAGVTEFAWDSGNVEVDINDADNETTIQRIGAWWYHFITTDIGIAEAFGAMAWESVNSIRINSSAVDLRIDNRKTQPLKLVGGRMYRDDGQSIIAATSNSVHVDYAPVYTVETGVSGLTAAESAKLDGISTVAADVWVQPDRQLTATDNTEAELTAADHQAIVDGVWAAAERSLTESVSVSDTDADNIAQKILDTTV